MRLVNRDELAKMPGGTVFMLYRPHVFDSEFRIKMPSKTNKHDGKEVWYAELSLKPNVEEVGRNKYASNWITVDTTYYDYDDKDLFAVFSDEEIKKIIKCFEWALTQCKGEFDMDTWVGEGKETYTDVEIWDLTHGRRNW